MVEDDPPCSVECSVISVPTECLQSISHFDSLLVNNEYLNFGLGSNSVIINKNTGASLGLNVRSTSHDLWSVLTLKLTFQVHYCGNNEFVHKRLIPVVIDEKVYDNVVIMSDDLLFNLVHSSDQRSYDNCPQIGSFKPILKLSYEERSEICLPTKASKVVLSLLQPVTRVEEEFIDTVLRRYFSYPKYLFINDVFSVHVGDKSKMCEFSVAEKVGMVCFKVCEIHGPHNNSSEINKTCQGFFVDSSVTVYQVPNQQDFFPSRKVPPCHEPNLYTLLSDDKIMNRLLTHNHNLVPLCFDEPFNILCSWMSPFLCRKKITQDAGLNPMFLITGKNGIGKSLLLQALSHYFGVKYWRIDCVTIGGAIPGQAEAKVKNIFNELKNVAPCILHLSNIEVLCQDADLKEDVRVLSYFEHQLKTLKPAWPVVIVSTTHSRKCIGPNLNHWFLDAVTLNPPNCEQRSDILTWLIHNYSESINTDILQTVSSQSSGFVFRDLQVLVDIAIKEKYKRQRKESTEDNDFILSDFYKTLGTMHKAYSDSIGAPKVPSVLWKDVGGLEFLKKEILRSLRSNMFNTGLKRSGLLLHGPPGTGKTLLGKAVATQCGRNFLSVKGPELLNMYVGQSEHNVRDLFEIAKAAAPCIIFFDELDSLAPNRGKNGDSGGVMDRVVSQLLAEMDDLSNSADVFILGATNRPDLIDPALLRPGRLDKLLYVGPCEDDSSKLSVITALTRKLNLEADVDLQEIVSLLPASVSGAQLSALCSAAWLTSARQFIHGGEPKTETKVIINKAHFHSALSEVFSLH